MKLFLCLLLLLFLPVCTPAAPPVLPTVKTLRVGDSEVFEFDRMATAAIGSPAIADIVPLSARRLLVNARAAGETTLFVYDRHGRHRMRLTVVLPAPDLSALAAQVQAEIGLPAVTVRAVQDTLFLEGSASSAVALQRAAAIAGVYTPKVRNLLTVAAAPEGAARPTLAQTYAVLLTEHLAGTGVTVQVVDEKTIALLGAYASHTRAVSVAATPHVPARDRRTGKFVRAGAGDAGPDDGKFALDTPETSARRGGDTSPDPLDRLLQSLPTELKVVDMINLGSRPTRQILVRAKIVDINRSATQNLGINWGSLDSAAARGGQSYTFQPQPILFGQVGGGLVTNPLAGGSLRRIFPLAAQLDALIAENKARVLSEPSLMVLDGSEGSILVGGEIPIPVAQASNGTSGTSASVTIEYKPYGVRLLVGAALVGDGTVQMTVTPEVSELNYGAAVQISGFVVPSLTVRRATSTLQMADGETLVIGGLYSSTTSRQVTRIPLLSRIPVLGEFFKSTTTRKEENELLILIQPEIVKPGMRGGGRGDFGKDAPMPEPPREP